MKTIINLFSPGNDVGVMGPIVSVCIVCKGLSDLLLLFLEGSSSILARTHVSQSKISLSIF